MKKTVIIILLFNVLNFGQTSKINYLTFNEAMPILSQMKSDLPEEVKLIKTSQDWLNWVKKSDADIRSRLEKGDEDSIINQLLFGTSFTKQPRLTDTEIGRLAKEKSVNPVQLYEQALGLRLEDYVNTTVTATNIERLAYARDYFKKRIKVDLNTDAGKTEVKKIIINALVRVLNEANSYTRIIEEAKYNSEKEFEVRSQVYQNRGLSSDTTLKPNLAIEEAIKQLKEKGLLKNVVKVAVVGPGLDFTDKDQGYDFYPPQTIQPFALIESLIKHRLTTPEKIKLNTYDLSPKVNFHIAGFSLRFIKKDGYIIQLPLATDTKWTTEFESYWKNFGSVIGFEVLPMAMPRKFEDLKNRSISVKNEFLGKIKPFDTNIVLQSPNLLEKDKYDLIIGTNIFVYYGKFEQALAMKNLDKMLKKGGVLLSNDALTEVPTTKLNSIGKTEVHYSDKNIDGDRITWYQKK